MFKLCSIVLARLLVVVSLLLFAFPWAFFFPFVCFLTSFEFTLPLLLLLFFEGMPFCVTFLHDFLTSQFLRPEHFHDYKYKKRFYKSIFLPVTEVISSNLTLTRGYGACFTRLTLLTKPFVSHFCVRLLKFMM